MRIKRYIHIHKARIAFQTFFLFLFLAFFFIPVISGNLTEIFFWFDPLLLLMNFIASLKIYDILLFSLIPLILTLFFGRFFCGWICPFGTLNQFFSWLFRKSNKKRTGSNKTELKIKYLILITLVVSALLGVHLWGWLDPFSLFTRSLTMFAPSIDYLVHQTSILETGKSFLGEYQRVAVYPYLIVGLFWLFIGLNYYSKRFFCNTICPLGALYGFVSRFGLLKFATVSSCNSCSKCKNNCTYCGDPDKNYLSSECLVCFNCAIDCPFASVITKFEFYKNIKTEKIDLSKRNLIGSIITGTLTAALLKSTVYRKTEKNHSFIRPPGSVNEQEFIEKCARCGQCVESCTTSFIQPAISEAGLEGLWTPIVNAKAGYCLYDCKTCTEVCPTNALEQISLSEKKVFKIGTAIINKNLCYTYSDGFTCTICFDKCPTPEKAIKQREIEIWSFMGRLTKVKQIYIDPDSCTGCGICEYVCPRTDAPGIYITAADEQREKVTGIV